ncbi:MAG TPA: hypothetical protein VD741_08465 [Solirubrobacterales bacterium]|nr:hypothetical protein [Solirubrobacterales bacterium]
MLAALPTVLPAPFALPPMSPTALLTASTFELLPDEPLLEAVFCDRDLLLACGALAPLLELRVLAPADFRFAAFAGFALAFGALAFELVFDEDFALFDVLFDVDRFFDLDFVWAIVSSPRAVPWIGP